MGTGTVLGEQGGLWVSRERINHADIEMGGHFRQQEQPVHKPWGRTGLRCWGHVEETHVTGTEWRGEKEEVSVGR